MHPIHTCYICVTLCLKHSYVQTTMCHNLSDNLLFLQSNLYFLAHNAQLLLFYCCLQQNPQMAVAMKGEYNWKHLPQTPTESKVIWQQLDHLKTVSDSKARITIICYMVHTCKLYYKKYQQKSVEVTSHKTTWAKGNSWCNMFISLSTWLPALPLHWAVLHKHSIKKLCPGCQKKAVNITKQLQAAMHCCCCCCCYTG